MNAMELALAVVLLTSPPDTLEIPNPGTLHSIAAPVLKALALQWELLDPRETDYLTTSQDFVSDLKLLQGRYQELFNAPRASEVERFPGRDLVSDMMKFNRDYKKSVEERLDLDMIHGDELRTILMETDNLHKIYAAIADARCDYYYVTYRRQQLAEIRDRVGLESFYTGQLPPHVPLWRIPDGPGK